MKTFLALSSWIAPSVMQIPAVGKSGGLFTNLKCLNSLVGALVFLFEQHSVEGLVSQKEIVVWHMFSYKC